MEIPEIAENALRRFTELNLIELGLRLAAALVLFLAALALGWVLTRVARRALERSPGTRTTTLAPSVGTLIMVTAVVGGLLGAADQVGLDITTLLAGAGVVGLAVGFGAQTLVKDCISGFFLILDGVVEAGDLISLHGHRGVVERVGLRMTEVRAFDGVLWYVPNGQVDIVGNYSRDWVRFIVEVGVAYEGDVSHALRVLQEVGDAWYAENEDESALERPEAQGVVSLDSSSVGVRLVGRVKARARQVFEIERELALRAKARFDDAGVEIPFPRRVVYERRAG